MSDAATRIGFLGAGKMATALAKGWLKSGLVAAERLSGSDPILSARTAFAKDTGGFVTENNLDVVRRAELLVLAVKPQSMPALLIEIAPALGDQHLVVSIAAGVSLSQLTAAVSQNRRVIRVMPNTPALVGSSASAYSGGGAATADDLRTVERFLASVGRAIEVPEKLLDAVTGLSGSGPAYAFVMIEALSDGGVRMGLPRDVATLLAAQTLLGAAQMVLETGLHPGVLKDQVTSPGGTTIAGLHALEHGGIRATLIDAVEAATLRARELGAPPKVVLPSSESVKK
jgi:pyrroline-5-carboxylate reductase